MKSSETLVVRNFCGIDRAEISISQVLVMIGPQSSGKSIIAKLLFWARICVSNIYYYALGGGGRKEIIKICRQRFNDIFIWSHQDDFEVVYSIDGLEIRVRPANKRSLKVEFSANLNGIISDYARYITRQSKEEEESEGPRSAMDRKDAKAYYAGLLGKISSKSGLVNSPIYVPAARSFFSQVEASLFAFLASNNRLDPVMEGFGDYFSWVRNSFVRIMGNEQDSSFVDNLYKNLLKGSYVRDRGKDYIRHEDGRIIPISSASSGQQEIFPLCLLLGELARTVSPSRMIVIEEPEAHLHPSAQRTVIEAIIHAVSCNDSQVVITTHSPYVLSVVNNLYLKGRLMESGKDGFDYLVRSSERWDKSYIKPGNLAAYNISKGSAESLMDEHVNLLRADSIDDISGDISAEFDELLEAIY